MRRRNSVRLAWWLDVLAMCAVAWAVASLLSLMAAAW